jgi:acyl carrier protein
MNRRQVFELIRGHLADELEVDPDGISEATRFREDLEADSLDLYTLVQELEDSYGVRSQMKRRPRSSRWVRPSTSSWRAARSIRVLRRLRVRAPTPSDRQGYGDRVRL